MSETVIVVNTAVAVLATVVLIVRFRLNPVISLVIGAVYLGLTAVHVTSNTFRLLQSLLGRSVRGTLKTCSVGVSVASVVAILPLSLVV